MPIEELMKMYSAAENESTDLQSDEESSQESSEEGRKSKDVSLFTIHYGV